MEFLYEKVAYLKGLADGLEIEETTKEGRLLIKIIDMLEDFADAIVELDEDADEMAEYIEAMDEDLTNIEDDLYEDEDEDDEDDEDEDDEDIDFVELECPNCHEEVYIDEDLLYEDDIDVVCPRCNEKIQVVEDCGCGCNHSFDDEE